MDGFRNYHFKQDKPGGILREGKGSQDMGPWKKGKQTAGHGRVQVFAGGGGTEEREEKEQPKLAVYVSVCCSETYRLVHYWKINQSMRLVKENCDITPLLSGISNTKYVETDERWVVASTGGGRMGRPQGRARVCAG